MTTVSPCSAGRFALFPWGPALGISALVDEAPSDSVSAAGGGGELASLLPAIARGDRAAFAELYRRTSAKLFGIARRVTGDEGAAEEVLQDVFVTVWNKAGQFEVGRASPISWLAVLTRNRAIDRKRRSVLPTAPIEAADAVPADAPLADALFEQAEEAGRLHDCLDALDARARGYIRAAFIDGATYPELASRDDVPLGTMKSWIRRGLQSLRGCLES
ncbi:sigma-70 family RNA polymerase sigma factor [Sphingomonas sp. ASV193]|uniref:sigma-70 family RNA polymerase sigma factor n=1 Tax=Sphingomonas sp. ASV193 TaxID=3144405 RepID=UPI0032E8DA5B